MGDLLIFVMINAGSGKKGKAGQKIGVNTARLAIFTMGNYKKVMSKRKMSLVGWTSKDWDIFFANRLDGSQVVTISPAVKKNRGYKNHIKVKVIVEDV